MCLAQKMPKYLRVILHRFLGILLCVFFFLGILPTLLKSQVFWLHCVLTLFPLPKEMFTFCLGSISSGHGLKDAEKVYGYTTLNAPDLI